MTRLFTEGGEFGDVLFFNYVNGISCSTTRKRSGNYSFYLLQSQDAYHNLQSYPSEFYFRYAYNDNGGGHCSDVEFRNGTNVIASCRFTWSWTGTPNVFSLLIGGNTVATSSFVTLSNVWVLIEGHLKIADSGGIFETKYDGVDDMYYYGDTKPGADTNITNINLHDQFYNGAAYYDDLALNDTNGVVDNSWCGDGHVVLLTPNGNGDASDLIGQDGDSTNNYLNVDEAVADGDTSYNQSATSGQRDLYQVSDYAGAGKTILRVWPECRARDTVAAGGEYYDLIKVSGGSERRSVAKQLLTTYTQCLKGEDYLLNPETGVAWTEANLDNIQVGFEVK